MAAKPLREANNEEDRVKYYSRDSHIGAYLMPFGGYGVLAQTAFESGERMESLEVSPCDGTVYDELQLNPLTPIHYPVVYVHSSVVMCSSALRYFQHGWGTDDPNRGRVHPDVDTNQYRPTSYGV